jgi:hypothetical protein
MSASDLNKNMPQNSCEQGPCGMPPAVMFNGAVGDGSAQRHSLADYPALAALRLTDDDLDGLSYQGFVCREQRGHLVFFKLRFRRARRQIVRYVRNAQHAEDVCAELRRLQADRRMDLQLGRIAKLACRMLREGKCQLEPIVQAEQMTFHGLALRRPRKPRIQQ